MSIIHSNIEFWSSFENKVHSVKLKLSTLAHQNEIIGERSLKLKKQKYFRKILPSWKWQLLSSEIDLDRHLFETETE